MWVIQCMVTGGVTGTRVSLLKRRDKVCYFKCRNEAQARADALEKSANDAYATARFYYTVVAIDSVFN